MHTSKIILLTLTGLIIAFLIANMILLRQDLQWIVDREKETAYINVPIGDVKTLQVSGLWDIRIRQAREPTLELAFEDKQHEGVDYEGDVLVFKNDSTQTTKRKARVSLPALYKINATQGSTINMESYIIDSLYLALSNQTIFKGKNNYIKFLSIKSSGEVQVQLTDDGSN